MKCADDTNGREMLGRLGSAVYSAVALPPDPRNPSGSLLEEQPPIVGLMSLSAQEVAGLINLGGDIGANNAPLFNNTSMARNTPSTLAPLTPPPPRVPPTYRHAIPL